MNRLRIVTGSKKRLGRGYGSGKGGHTVGRGQKGQKARDKIGILFEGLKVKKSFFKRIPLLRGKGRNKSILEKPYLIRLSLLNSLDDNEVVDEKLFVKKGWFSKNEIKKRGVKVVYDKSIEKKLIIRVPVTKSVQKAVESVGGKIEA